MLRGKGIGFKHHKKKKNQSQDGERKEGTISLREKGPGE